MKWPTNEFLSVALYDWYALVNQIHYCIEKKNGGTFPEPFPGPFPAFPRLDQAFQLCFQMCAVVYFSPVD